jgi:hypothetical protein
MKKHGRASQYPAEPAPNAATKMSSHSGPHIFSGPFSHRKMKLLLYQFPRADRPVSTRSCTFPHLSFRSVHLLLSIRGPSLRVSQPNFGRVDRCGVAGAGTRLYIWKGCTAAVGCWDTKDSFRDCGRNFAAVTDELLSASCLISPLPVLWPPSPHASAKAGVSRQIKFQERRKGPRLADSFSSGNRNLRGTALRIPYPRCRKETLNRRIPV